MRILRDFMKRVSWVGVVLLLLVVAAPATSQGIDFSVAGAAEAQIPAGAALEGSDAYAALLDLYIREHPDAARDREFLPYFAGLGCLAQGWGRNQNLNPFEVAEIESAAQLRLDRKLAEASGSPAVEPVLITFRVNVAAGDYDMAQEVFPIMAAGGAHVAVIRPDDFCRNVAKAKYPSHRSASTFPVNFRIAAADGAILGSSHVVEMLGGKVAIGRERARAFYERGFPTIVVEVTGRVHSVMRAKAGTGFITLEPVQATLRSQGSARHAPELALLGKEQLDSFIAGTGDGSGADGEDGLMRFDRDVYLVGSTDLKPRPVAGVQYSTLNLDASEAEAMTGAIRMAIGTDLRLVEFTTSGAEGLTNHMHDMYVLVAGDWRDKLTHAIASSHPNMDFNVIQIAAKTRTVEDISEDGSAGGTAEQAASEIDFRPR